MSTMNLCWAVRNITCKSYYLKRTLSSSHQFPNKIREYGTNNNNGKNNNENSTNKSSPTKKYSETLILPKTDFPARIPSENRGLHERAIASVN